MPPGSGGDKYLITSSHNMASSTYDTASPRPALDFSSPQLDTAHFCNDLFLETCAPDPQSNKEPLQSLQMPLFSASGDLTRDEACEIFADCSALPSAVSGFDNIDWDEWMSFDSPAVDVPPPSLHMSDFSDGSIEEADSSPCDVADDQPH